jgi:BMFP domain-containing protein YqiC
MFDRKKIDELTQRFMDAIPPGLKDFKKDLEKNFRSVLQTTFAKMDLITREEFDVQVNVLKRTRQKLEMLEKKLAQIEENSRKTK